MATQLFKDGESIMVRTKAVQRHIAGGWSPEDPDAPPVELKIVPPHLHIGSIPVAPDKDAETVALAAMGIITHPVKIGAMHVAV